MKTTTQPMTSNLSPKNMMNILKASPRRAFWLALAVVCLSALVVIPLARTRAAASAPPAPGAVAPGLSTAGVQPAPVLRNLNRTAGPASFEPTPFTVGTCDTAGPIEVESTGGTAAGVPTAYATLKLAFDAINPGVIHTGSIGIDVCGNTTETATASLNSGTVAPGSYTDVTIRPVGAARVITGSIVGAIIKLNGADNVTIDGRIGGVGSARSLTVSNSNTSAATAAIWLASVAAGNGASLNVIRNLEIAAGTDSGNSTNASFGIIMCGITIGTTINGDDNDNNQFIFNRIIKARYGIVTRGTTTNLNIAPIVTDNIIGPSAFGTDQIGKTGIFMQADTGATVSRNTVQSVGTLVTQANGFADHCGICIGTESWGTTDTTTLTSLNYTVTRNTVHDIIEEKTGSAIGIKLGTTQSGGATGNLVANNFIYNIRANGTSGDQVVGIGIAGGNGDSVVNNSISMTGDMDPGAASATSTYGNAIRIPGANAANNANFIVRNNSIYLDASSSSTAAQRFYAITLNSAAFVFGTGALNNNNYYINAANTQLQTGGLATTGTGTTTTTQFATLALWQAALTAPQDAASIQANPLHVSPTADLHITGTSPNIDVGATIAAVPVDIDNEARPNGAAYDIGADEFYPAPGVLQLSSTTYGGNEGTTLVATVNRVSGSSGTVGATYTLADGSGAVGGAACGVGVDYVNPGPQMLSFGDSVTSQPINVTLCTDAVLDPAETFTITLSLPTGGASLGSPTVATATITDVPPPFSGTYTVGTGGNYPSLTNPGGIFAAINLSGATGNVTIDIISDLAGETGTFALNPITSPFTVLIKPSGAARAVSGSLASNALIRLNGASRVTIDGSTSGGTDRSLTISNTSITAPSVVLFGSVGTTPITNDTLKNCIIINGVNTSSAVVISDAGTLGSAGFFNGVTIQNNSIQKAFIGVFATGGTSPQNGANLTYTQNSLNTSGANAIRNVGLYMQGVNGATVSQNTIGSFNGADGESDKGVWIATGTTNATVERNTVGDLNYTGTAGWGPKGIQVSTGLASANVVVKNNFVYNLTGDGDSYTSFGSSFNPVGIYAFGTGQGGVKIYHNSVNLYGNTLNFSAQSMSAGIAIDDTTTAEVRDNSVVNNLGRLGATGYGAVGIFLETSLAANLTAANNNDYFVSSTGGGVNMVGQIATTGSSTIAAWQTATGMETGSVQVNPLYVSLTDLHLQGASPLIGAGLLIAGVDNDFDSDLRDNVPDIGADEIVSGRGGTIPPGTYRDGVIGAAGLAGNTTFTGTLTLTGIVTASPFTLTIDCGGSIAGGVDITNTTNTGNFIIGNVRKNYCTTSTFVYPVGTVNGSSPAQAEVTATGGTAGDSLTVLAVQGVYSGPETPPVDPNSLLRYWDLNETGSITANMRWTFRLGDVQGGGAGYKIIRINSVTASFTNAPDCPTNPFASPCVNLTDNYMYMAGISTFSKWTAGQQLAPTAAGAKIGGRILDANGRPIANARVFLSGGNLAQPVLVQTGPFGYYTFEGLEVSRIYVVTVSSGRHTFTEPSRAIDLSSDILNADFVAAPPVARPAEPAAAGPKRP